MLDPANARVQGIFAVTTLSAAFFLFVLLGPSLGPNPPFPYGVGTSPDWNVADGLSTAMYSQNVSGSPYWEPYCESPNPTSYCAYPIGVAYDPGANIMLLTEGVAAPTGGQDAIMEFNPVTLQAAPLLPLNCYPEVPFYPGSGPDFYVPCLNLTSPTSGPLLVVSAQTESVIDNMSLPFRTDSMVFDSTNGMIYATGGSNGLAEIDPVTNEVVNVVAVSDGSFSNPLNFGDYLLAFDPATNELIAPAANNSLMGIAPDTGVPVSFILTGTSTAALAVDPTTNQLLVANDQTDSALDVFTATTYRLLDTISFPSCISYICSSGTVNQILIDPAHGDAYLVATGWLFTLNLSAVAVVGVIEDYGDGAQQSSAYVVLDDRIFGTYSDFIVGPGFLIQLDHTTEPVITDILWMPTDLGTLVAAVAIGTATALLASRAVRRRRAALLRRVAALEQELKGRPVFSRLPGTEWPPD